MSGRIHKFTGNGSFLMEFGRYGHEAGEFESALQGIALDDDNNIYAVTSR